MATTWANQELEFARKAAFTTGTETITLTGDADFGIHLKNLESVAVFVEAAGAMTAGGKFLAYLRNRLTGRWTPCEDLDLTVTAIQYKAFAGVFVAPGADRLAYVPSGVGVASDLYVIGARR